HGVRVAAVPLQGQHAGGRRLQDGLAAFARQRLPRPAQRTKRHRRYLPLSERQTLEINANRKRPAGRAGRLVGPARFELTNVGVKVRCLTTWLRPRNKGCGWPPERRRARIHPKKEKDRAAPGLCGLWWGA